ncbi:MAG: AMP-binding protein [Caldimonas sp.]
MSPPGRPKGEYRSAQHEGAPLTPPGRPKGEYRSAQHEGGQAAGEPLLGDGDLDTVVARRDGVALTRRRYLADAAALAERLPQAGAMLNLALDRYRFAVGFGAALLRGHTSLLPPNRTAHTVERLRLRFPQIYALVDGDDSADGLPTIAFEDGPAGVAGAVSNPSLPVDQVAAFVLTSGSTGDPVPHAKPWGGLVLSARAEAARLAEVLGRPSLAGVTLVATVPAQHMYGLESSLLVALHGGAAFDAGRPFYPADIVAALSRTPAPRLLVTTPFHLKALLDSGLALPRLDLVLCATAPLAPQLAARAESRFDAPLVEIYGCTEAGQVATRRTTAGAEWQTFAGLGLSGDGAAAIVSGGHVPTATPLADVLEVLGSESFRLLGRSNDLVNIAGKRSSLAHLNFHLNAIEGVLDGAFWLPAESGHAAEIVRLLAFVVAPGVATETIRAALRSRVDAAFLPRRIVHVDALPREPTGKLTRTSLAAFAAGHGVPRG